MAENTSTLLIKLLATGDLAAFTHGKEQSEALKVSLEGLKVAMELVGVGMSLGALVEGTKAAIEYGANIKRLADQANISAEAFQKLAFAATEAGMGQDELSTSLNTMNRNLAQAAQGASKQNKAIEDLHLNTAELLALPVEEQLQEIARAYENSENKTRAWADVVALLGRNSATTRKLLEDMGKAGIDQANENIIMNEAEVESLHKKEAAVKLFWMNVKAITGQIVARPGDALLSMFAGPQGALAAFEMMGNRGPEKKKEGMSSGQIASELEESEAMKSAKEKEIKALSEVQKAYEGPIEAAKRLRNEAEMLMRQWDVLSLQKGNPLAQLEAVRLRTEAAKLAGEANREDEKASREKALHESEMKDIYAKITQLETKRGPLNEQIAQAKSRETELANQLAGLSEKSLTHDAEEKRILTEILAVKTEISALEEKDAIQRVEQMIKIQDIQNRREAIAIAAIEHDYNLSDNQKWDEKQNILRRVVAEQEAYIANMKKIADDSAAPQGARDKASNAVSSGENAIAGSKEQMGAMGPNPNSIGGQIDAGIKSAIGHAQTLAQVIGSTVGNAISKVNDGIKSWINGTMTFKQAMQNAGQKIFSDFASRAEDAFLAMLEKYAISKLKMFAIDEAMAAKGLLLSAASAAKSLIMWIPAAIAASISSWGIAAAIGAAAVIGIVASGGFEAGGFTGGQEGEAAGIVHGQEFVWSAPAVRAIGAGNLERAHQAALGSGGGVSAGGGASGASGNIILAMSPEDIARSQRRYTDARVQRLVGRIPSTRYSA